MREPMISTGAGPDDVANLTGELSIADHPQVGDHTDLIQSTLRKAILCFDQTATAACQQGQQVLASGSDASTARSVAVSEISLLYRTAYELENDAKILRHWTERSIVERVSLFGGQRGPHTKDLLKHFHKQIMENARNVLNSSDDEACVLWQTAEECYKEAIRPSGRLGSDGYFYWIDRAAEESYEHENRLDVDEHYAELRSRNMKVHEARKMKERQETRQNWVEFWVRALSNCPGGPTLFYPPAACSAARSIEGPPFEDIPRFLFRAFDSKGSGKTEDNYLASTMSMFGNSEGSKVDILSLETHSASEMLYTHLVKDCFGGSASDNLMSWSSSLMCVIQYAIWRSHIGSLSPAEVRICVIHAARFPPGQFVRDMTLLKAFNNMELSENQKDLFCFRLENPEYDNGEYLSQGVVNHRGRSCTFSLQDLIDGGLYELYPEFGDTGSGGYGRTGYETFALPGILSGKRPDKRYITRSAWQGFAQDQSSVSLILRCYF
uniref:DUF7587 domain-containing protein n=1 Tax=Bionectria ochroleuca TaxID=29856 RepID=A0A8H7MYY2_BIOOC